jgi:hypothetical protein
VPISSLKLGVPISVTLWWSLNLIKIRSTHLLPIFYQVFFDCRLHMSDQKIGSNCVDLILIRFLEDRDTYNSPRRVLMDSPFSVGTHQSFQILHPYNDRLTLAWQHVVSNRNSVIASFHDCQFSCAEML